MSVLLANWKYILIAALVAYGGWQHMEVLSLEKAAAQAQLAAEKAAKDYLEANQKQTNELSAARDATRAALQGKANAEQNRIAAAPRTDSCINTPAYRAWLNGVPDGAKAANPKP